MDRLYSPDDRAGFRVAAGWALCAHLMRVYSGLWSCWPSVISIPVMQRGCTQDPVLQQLGDLGKVVDFVGFLFLARISRITRILVLFVSQDCWSRKQHASRPISKSRSLIMKTTLDDRHFDIVKCIHKAVFLGYTSRPVTLPARSPAVPAYRCLIQDFYRCLNTVL